MWIYKLCQQAGSRVLTPFDESPETSPLTLTLHEQTFKSGLTREEEASIGLLYEMSNLREHFNVVSTDASSRMPSICTSERPREDMILVSLRDEDGASVTTSIWPWSQWPKLIEAHLGTMPVESRREVEEHFIWALAHSKLQRHLFVTTSKYLMDARVEKLARDWNCVTPQEAVAICGLLLRGQGQFITGVSGYTVHRLGAGLFYTALAFSLLPGYYPYAIACADCVSEEKTEDALHLAQSILGRLGDAIRARDFLAQQLMSPNPRDDLLHYHFPVGIINLTGAFEAQAGLCCLVHDISMKQKFQVTFRNDTFITQLHNKDPQLAKCVDDRSFQSFLNMLWPLRNAIQHQEGLLRAQLVSPHSEGFFLYLGEEAGRWKKALTQLGGFRPKEWGIADWPEKAKYINPPIFLDRAIREAARMLDAVCVNTDLRHLLPTDWSPPVDDEPADSVFSEVFREANLKRVRLLAGFPW